MFFFLLLYINHINPFSFISKYIYILNYWNWPFYTLLLVGGIITIYNAHGGLTQKKKKIKKQ